MKYIATMKNDCFPMRLVQATAVVMTFVVIGCNGSVDPVVPTNVANWISPRAKFTDHGGNDIITGDNARKMIKRSPHLVKFPQLNTQHGHAPGGINVDENQPPDENVARPSRRAAKPSLGLQQWPWYRKKNLKRWNCIPNVDQHAMSSKTTFPPEQQKPAGSLDHFNARQ